MRVSIAVASLRNYSRFRKNGIPRIIPEYFSLVPLKEIILIRFTAAGYGDINQVDAQADAVFQSGRLSYFHSAPTHQTGSRC